MSWFTSAQSRRARTEAPPSESRTPCPPVNEPAVPLAAERMGSQSRSPWSATPRSHPRSVYRPRGTDSYIAGSFQLPLGCDFMALLRQCKPALLKPAGYRDLQGLHRPSAQAPCGSWPAASRSPTESKCGQAPLTIDTTATPPELADGFGVAHSAGWERRSTNGYPFKSHCHKQPNRSPAWSPRLTARRRFPRFGSLRLTAVGLPGIGGRCPLEVLMLLEG